MTSRLQKLILGDDIHVVSEIDKSRIRFLAGTIVVNILISMFFLAYDIYLGYPSSVMVYVPFTLVFGYSLHLLRSFKYDAGRYVFLLSMNFFVYIIMSSIPEDSMSAIFYVAIMVIEYVLLGHERKYWLFSLLGLTFFLYVLDAYSEFSLLAMRHYDDATLQVNKMVDFVICVVSVLMSIKLLIDYLQYIISERIKDNEELEKVNLQLDKYSYTITHDLKGSLYAMLRLVELPVIDNANYDQHLDSMKENLHGILGLIDEVTEQARNKNMGIKQEVFNVSKLVEDAWELVRHSPEAQTVDLILDIPKGLEISTDKGRLNGILNNLLINAIRYHDKSKNTQFIKLSGYVDNGWFHLIVDDNGLGIDQSDHQKIFEMFYRGSNILGGSGLGLFIVKESIDKLGGQIDLESKKGQGTLFQLKIPIDA